MSDSPFRSNGRPRGGTNGGAPAGMHTRPVAFDELSEPVDLVAVQADDELINALAAGMSVSAPGIGGYDADDRVAAILAAWKADVDAEPIPELVDLDTAVSTVLAARPPSRRARHLVPVAAAAAFIVLAVGGVSVSSYNARPDDVLWGVSKVLYSERAESVEAAARAEEHIANAKEALVSGQPVVAAQELARAETELAVVRPQEGQGELAATQDFLEAKAAETPEGQPADPGTPLTSEPARPVPPGARDPRPRPSQQETDTTTAPDGSTSGTSSPEPGSGPEVARTPGSGDPGTSTRPTNDVRRAPVAPDASSDATRPEPSDGHGEGGQDDPTGSPPPSPIDEGGPDPTTSPTPPPPPPPSSSGAGGATGTGGPDASGSEPAPTSG